MNQEKIEDKKILDDDVNIKCKLLGQLNNTEKKKIRDLEETVKAQRKEIESLKSIINGLKLEISGLYTINEGLKAQLKSIYNLLFLLFVELSIKN